MKRILFSLCLCSVIPFQSAYAADQNTVLDFIEPYFKQRWRYEFVTQGDKEKDAHAKTVRTVVGIKTKPFYHLTGLLEGENVAELTDQYNNTVNGHTNRPVVADLENTQLNQGFLEFTGIPDTTIRGGRSVIALDNQRFIGHVGWRQNNQVFDAAMITNTSLPETTAVYGYIYNVNRIFGEGSQVGDWNAKSHFYNISNASTSLGTFTTYGYLLDFGSDSPSNASNTFGGSFSGSIKQGGEGSVVLKYYGEYAYQTDHADNTVDYKAHYYHLVPEVVWKGFHFKVGYEVLGSDNGIFGFQTPLATGHKFNGWTDKFLTTPAAGLEDFYMELSYHIFGLSGFWKQVNGLIVKAHWHDFSSEEGGTDYGNEIGVFMKKKLSRNVWTSVKYSSYIADDFAADTQKVTFDVGINF